MHARIDSEALLTLWERGLACSAAGRGDALLAAARAGTAARTLGERNAMLVALHVRVFGRELALRSQCPECGHAAQFDVDCEALAARIGGVDPATTHRLEVEDHAIEFRLPGASDVHAAAASPAPDEFALRVAERCVLACTRGGAPVPMRELDPAVLDALSARMEALDPGASIAFSVECPQCAASWNARCDLAAALWQKIQAAAERVLLDIDTLARAYGWTEPEVLRLTPVRRAAYLQLADA